VAQYGLARRRDACTNRVNLLHLGIHPYQFLKLLNPMKKLILPAFILLFYHLRLSAQIIVNAGSDRTICAGGSVSLNATATGSTGIYTYAWTPSSSLNNPSVLNPIAKPSVTTDFILKVTDNMGNSGTDTIRIIIDSNLYRPAITLNAGSINPFCEGDYVELMASNASSYKWSTGSINSFLVVSESASITVTATRSDGCIGISDPFIVSMKPRTPTPTFFPTGVVSVCNTYATLTAQNSLSPVTFEWSTGETTDSITVVSPGMYSVIATDSSGCTSLPATKTVIGQPTGFITSSGNQTFCNGDSILITLHTAPENSVLWNTGDTLSSIWVKDPDTYTATITTPEGCSDVAQNDIIIDVIQTPAAPLIIPTGPTSFCEGGNVGLKVSGGDPYVYYEWNTGDYTDSINVALPGIYSVKAYDIFGCTSDTASVIVAVNPYPAGSVVADGKSSICDGDSLRLFINATNGSTYHWNNGSSGVSIWIKNAGNYKAMITSAEGCSDSTVNSISVGIKPLPHPYITQNGNVLLASPSSDIYQWYLNDNAVSGATGTELNISKGGLYRLQATLDGCTASVYHNAILRQALSGITYQVFPNPVVTEMNIIYSLNKNGTVDVSVHDVQGKKIFHVVQNEMQSAGEHTYRINNASGMLHHGIYFVVFDFGGTRTVQRVLVL
jgi:hypothetical protein